MRRRIKLFYVLVAAFVIVACGLMTLNRLDQEIAVLEDTVREVRLQQVAVEAEKSEMQKEIAMKDTQSYIQEKARTLYGYVYPNEIRFVVVNPEALYDQEIPAEVEIVEQTAEDTAG
ncbi:MAG: septum formation initiator family protein [Clostridia bacterium]|nr:septum formation initiator family protein [Clostridia bacterium]